jgi:hypothetical protein
VWCPQHLGALIDVVGIVPVTSLKQIPLCSLDLVSVLFGVSVMYNTLHSKCSLENSAFWKYWALVLHVKALLENGKVSRTQCCSLRSTIYCRSIFCRFLQENHFPKEVIQALHKSACLARILMISKKPAPIFQISLCVERVLLFLCSSGLLRDDFITGVKQPPKMYNTVQ